MASFKDSAIRALGLGYRPFPVVVFTHPDPLKPGKRAKMFPVDWGIYRDNQKPTIELIEKWAVLYPFAGLALATGHGLTVLDFDSADGCSPADVAASFSWYDPTEFPAWCISGGKGLHIYCKDPEGVCGSSQAVFESADIKMDIRGTGGCIVGPGTPVWDKDPRGEYEQPAVIISEYSGNLEDVRNLPPVPEFVIEKLRSNSAPVYALMAEHDVIPQGKKHDVGASFFMGAVLRVPGFEKNPLVYDQMLKKYAESVLGTTLEELKRNPEELKHANALYSSAIKKIAGQEGYSERLLKPVIKQGMAEALQDIESKKDMGLWGFTVEKAIRVGDMLILYIVSDDPDASRARVCVPAGDMFNQSKFKTAFLIGTSRVLPTIKPKSFDKFIQSFEIKEEKGLGVELAETVKDELERRYTSVDVGDTEDEAQDLLQKRGMVRYNGDFMFKLQIFRIGSVALKTVKDTLIASTLSNLNCESKIFGRVGSVWIYRPL